MVIKQPNGNYCYFGYNGKVIKNLSEVDYLLLKAKEAKNIAKEELENCSSSPAELIKYHKVSDEDLKAMGYEKTYNEMLKYIPKRVTNSSYYGRDCTTYGRCPTCDAPVQNGMGGTDKVCRQCNQVLEW